METRGKIDATPTNSTSKTTTITTSQPSNPTKTSVNTIITSSNINNSKNLSSSSSSMSSSSFSSSSSSSSSFSSSSSNSSSSSSSSSISSSTAAPIDTNSISSHSTSTLEKKDELNISNPSTLSDEKQTTSSKIFSKEEMLAELDKRKSLEKIKDMPIPEEILNVRKNALNNFYESIEVMTNEELLQSTLFQKEFRDLISFEKLALANLQMSYKRIFKTPQREEALKAIKEKITESYTKFQNATITAKQAHDMLRATIQQKKIETDKNYNENSWFTYAYNPFAYISHGLFGQAQSQVSKNLEQILKNDETQDIDQPTVLSSCP